MEVQYEPDRQNVVSSLRAEFEEKKFQKLYFRSEKEEIKKKKRKKTQKVEAERDVSQTILIRYPEHIKTYIHVCNIGSNFWRKVNHVETMQSVWGADLFISITLSHLYT